MPKWDALRKTKRDIRIYRFWLAHQDLSHKEIGERFNMSRTNVCRIVNNFKRQTERGAEA